MVERQRLYEYGAVAWVWRGIMAFFAFLACVFLAAWQDSQATWILLAALALLVPSLFFGAVVVVTADRLEDGGLEVRTLLFWRRRLRLLDLGAPRVRIIYRSLPSRLSAPRVWIPVRGGLPLYFDLLGHIPDRQKFLAAIRLRAREIEIAR